MQYGPGIAAIGLTNLQLVPSRRLAVTFTPKSNARISWFEPCLKGGPGYSEGNGGMILITLRDVYAGTISEKILAYGIGYPGNPTNAPFWQNYPRILLIGGGKYYGGSPMAMVIENIDASPSLNFVSVNSLNNPGEAIVNQPCDPLSTMRIFREDLDKGWIRQGKTPIFAVGFEDGTSQGQGYSDARGVSGLVTITDQVKVREVIIPKQDATIKSAQAFFALSGAAAQWHDLSIGGASLKSGVPFYINLPVGATVYPISKAGNRPGVFTEGYWQSTPDNWKTINSAVTLDVMFSIELA